MKSFLRSLFFRDSDIKKSLRLQAKLSLLVLLAYFSYYFAVFDRRPKLLVIVGDSGQMEQSSQKEEAPQDFPWEVLLIDPNLRPQLWAKYDKTKDEEREEVFEIVFMILKKLSKDQGKHISEGFVKRDGANPSVKHNTRLMRILEALPESRAFLRYLVEHGDERPKGRVESLLESPEPEDLHFALYLVRHYGMEAHVNKISSLKGTLKNEKVRDDIEMTIQFLSTKTKDH